MRRLIWVSVLLGGVIAAAPLAADERDAQLRDRMVKEQLLVSIGGRMPIVNLRVLEAMRTVPRHRFVPLEVAALAYEDRPLPIGEGQTISQPYIVALMSEAADIQPGEKVLEIGTGSGYGAAVLAQLTDQVYTIEILDPLARRAKQTLVELGLEEVHVQVGDGFLGWPEEAPFDAILVTAAAPAVPEPLVDQLAVRGRLVIPVGKPDEQELVVFTKISKKKLVRETAIPVRFVPMTGQVQSTMQSLESHAYEIRPPADE